MQIIGKSLTSIPKNLSRPAYASVEILQLSGNKISDLDPHFCQHMTQLLQLDLSKNHIKHIDPSIEKLLTLKSLNLSYNNLKTIPSQLFTMPKLIDLTLSNNLIENLPQNFISNKTLTSLDLSKN